MIYLNLILIVAFSCVEVKNEQSKWNLRKQENGIRVFTQPTEDSDFETFRAITNINAQPDEIMEVLLDLEKVPEWIPDITHSRLLEGKRKGKGIVYVQYNLPWPISDRDVVFEHQFKRDADTLWLCSEIERGYLNKKEEYTRVESLKGFWKLVDLGNSTLATYQLHSDPGGKLPAWLVNWKITEAPYKTLRNLRKRVED